MGPNTSTPRAVKSTLPESVPTTPPQGHAGRRPATQLQGLRDRPRIHQGADQLAFSTTTEPMIAAAKPRHIHLHPGAPTGSVRQAVGAVLRLKQDGADIIPGVPRSTTITWSTRGELEPDGTWAPRNGSTTCPNEQNKRLCRHEFKKKHQAVYPPPITAQQSSTPIMVIAPRAAEP